MGIKSVQKTAPKQETRPDLVIDLSEFGDGEQMTFREPGVNHLIGKQSVRDKIKIDYPQLSDEVINLCEKMAYSYVPDGPEEAGMTVVERGMAFADLSLAHKDLWMRVLRDFGTAFPMDLGAAVEEAEKNT